MAEKRKKSWIDGLLYFINSLLALSLLLAYAAYYVNPGLVGFLEYFALAYPYALAANIIFALYWLLRLKIKIILPVLCIALGYNHVERTYQWSGSNKIMGGSSSLKVMSFNVRLFNYYRSINSEEIADEIRALIRREDPDVLLVQEYFKSNETPPFDFPYKKIELTNKGENWGLAIFSKYPLDSANFKESYASNGLPSDRPLRYMYADLTWREKTLRVYNVHLQSVGLDYKAYEDVKNPQDRNSEELQRGLRKIAGQISRSAETRSQQAQALSQSISQSPHPLLLGGDFNDVPLSYTYRSISSSLNDAFVEAGKGAGHTYRLSPLSFRIDYLLCSPQMRPQHYHTGPAGLSDHRPVWAQFEFR